MNSKLTAIGAALLSILLIATFSAAQPTTVILLGNSIDMGEASLFMLFLEEEVTVTRATADDFDSYKNEPWILILGGPDAPEGVGPIVQELLSEDDQAYLRTAKGNYGKYTFTDAWADDQVVHVLAGFDRKDTRKASQVNQGEILKPVETSVQSEENDSGTTPLLVLEIEKLGIDFPDGNSLGYLRNITYTLSNPTSTVTNPIIDVRAYNKVGDVLDRVGLFLDASETWPSDLDFDPLSNRVEILNDTITLPREGNYVLELEVTDAVTGEQLAFETKEFSVP